MIYNMSAKIEKSGIITQLCELLLTVRYESHKKETTTNGFIAVKSYSKSWRVTNTSPICSAVYNQNQKVVYQVDLFLEILKFNMKLVAWFQNVVHTEKSRPDFF